MYICKKIIHNFSQINQPQLLKNYISVGRDFYTKKKLSLPALSFYAWYIFFRILLANIFLWEIFGYFLRGSQLCERIYSLLMPASVVGSSESVPAWVGTVMATSWQWCVNSPQAFSCGTPTPSKPSRLTADSSKSGQRGFDEWILWLLKICSAICLRKK